MSTFFFRYTGRWQELWKQRGEPCDFSAREAVTALSENLERLEEAIGAACRAAGRARGEVELMAVSKTFPAEAIAEAARWGSRCLARIAFRSLAPKHCMQQTLDEGGARADCAFI
jgi:hypothetical protein